MDKKTVIRTVTETDLVAINDIYNHYVLNSTCTYQEEPESLEGRKQWFMHHDDRHPLLVAESNGQVVGWGSLTGYHPRSAYRHTVENSIYVDHRWHRRGIGTLLLHELVSRATQIGHRAIIAGIDAEQSGSIALHANFGFEHVGRFKKVGYKFGRWLDVVYMELIIGDNKPT